MRVFSFVYLVYFIGLKHTFEYVAAEKKLVFSLDQELSNGNEYTVTLNSDIEDTATPSNKVTPEQWPFTTVKLNNAFLTNLELINVKLNSTFKQEQEFYSTVVGYQNSIARIEANTVDNKATFTVDKKPTESGKLSEFVSMNQRINAIKIDVIAQNGETKFTDNTNLAHQSADNFAQQIFAKSDNTGASNQFGTNFPVWRYVGNRCDLRRQ